MLATIAVTSLSALSADAGHAAGLYHAPASLSSLVLRPAQVGSGYKRQKFEQGDQVDSQVTLDLCGQQFASEDLRTDRLQYGYARRKSDVWMSNEVVRYQPGGAQQALNELRTAARDCPKRAMIGPVAGSVPTRYRVRRINDSRLLPDSLALLVRETGVADGKSFDDTGVLVYQVRGDLLSGVYAFDGTLAARRRSGLHAAAASARNLRHGS